MSELIRRCKPLMPAPVKKKKKKRKSLSEMAIAIVGRRRKSLSNAAVLSSMYAQLWVTYKYSGVPVAEGNTK